MMAWAPTSSQGPAGKDGGARSSPEAHNVPSFGCDLPRFGSQAVPEHLLCQGMEPVLPSPPRPDQPHLLAELAWDPPSDRRHIIYLLGARREEVTREIVLILLALGGVVDVHLPDASGYQHLARGKGMRWVPPSIPSLPPTLHHHPPKPNDRAGERMGAPNLVPDCPAPGKPVPTGGRSPAGRARFSQQRRRGQGMISPVIYSGEPR